MTYTRKQLVTCVSIVYLIFATALAGYASSRANELSIPISNVLSSFATALPIVAGLLFEGAYYFNRLQERRGSLPKGFTPRSSPGIIANTLVFIYSTVVITLLGTHVAPASNLRCSREESWRTMFKTKNAEAIRTIQEAFSCCGFVNSHDQAWPFPDKTHDQHACESAFGRTAGCFAPWKAEEQRVAGILMAVVGLVFVWQFTIIATPTQKDTWLHKVLPNRVSNLIADEESGSSRPRRAIDYLPNFQHYRDDVAEEVDDGGNENVDRPQRAIDQGVQTVRNALPSTNGDQEQSRPTIENEWART